MIGIKKKCPDCRQGTVLVYPGDDKADCSNPNCDEEFSVIRNDDGSIILRHVPWGRARPDDETTLCMFNDIERLSCLECEQEIHFPVRQTHVTCYCGAAFVIGRDYDKNPFLILDTYRSKSTHVYIFDEVSA